MNDGKLIIYEINTRVWLNTLSRRFGREITLANVPETVIDELAALKISGIWLMGVWTRSRAGRDNALRYKHEYVSALVDIVDHDIIGSAYSIGKYEAADEAGGREGMAAFRAQLMRRNLKLIVDYVPNHVGLDHSWVAGDAGLCVRGTPELMKERSGDFFATLHADGQTVITAHGRDPNFPPWNDTAQVNAFNPVSRQATIALLRDIATQTDGVRCDMAMLMINSIFKRTWGWLVTDPEPEMDFWPEIVAAVRQVNPNFIFMAEAYWGLESQLQEQGFDYTYDKHLYDILRDEDTPALHQHLSGDVGYQRRTVRFVENHDEPRAVVAFESADGAKARCAATITMTLPGAVLLHDGQFEGRRIKLPVQITREMDEPVEATVRAFYTCLMNEARRPEYARGTFALLPVTGKLIAYTWTMNGKVRLIIANITQESQVGAVTLTDCGGRPLVNVDTQQKINSVGERLDVRLSAYGLNTYEIDLTAQQPQRSASFSDKIKQVVTWLKGDGARG